MENDMKFSLVIGVICVFGMMGCSNDNGTNAEPESELLVATEVKATRIGRNAVRVEWKDNSPDWLGVPGSARLVEDKINCLNYIRQGDIAAGIPVSSAQ